MERKPIFYLLNLTWGLPLTLCGAVVDTSHYYSYMAISGITG